MSWALRAESVIKTIIREIVHECAVRGHGVSDTLVAFMVKAVVLDPRNGFAVDRTLTKQDVKNLQELCLSKLVEKCSPSLDTIKMQMYFDMNYTSRREFLDGIHQSLESKLSPLRREITDCRVKTRDEFDTLYKKIISYILLRSDLGPPTDVNVVQEATAALQSIFHQSQMGSFVVLLKRDKEQQLNEFAERVTGILLFTRTNKKEEQGTGLCQPKPAALTEALPAVSKSIEMELSVSQSLAWRYTAVLEKLTDPDSQPDERDIHLVLLKQALYNIRQHEVFLKMLLADAYSCAERVETLQTELSSLLKQLKSTVQSKSAVPIAKVFPHFTALSKVWSSLQDEAGLLDILKNIMLSLQPLIASQAQLFPEDYLADLLRGSEVKTDEQRMSESSDERIVPAEMKAQEWLIPEKTTSFSNVSLEYSGVCGYTLVNRDGLLLPGNPNIGVLKHKEKLYVFNSKKAALTFASSPDTFITEVKEKAKLYPELIQLLKIHHQFSCSTPRSEMQPLESSLLKGTAKCDSETQTDIHPVETNLVQSYEWNEWNLRRKAIKMADLQTRVTHSTQTDLSHMRRENATQTWLPKDAVCQTKRDGENNVPRPQVYLAGLRGQRDGHMVKTNLTRSVDE